MLEQERSQIFQEVESEISNLARILDNIADGLNSILQDK
jgi:hypothetical protein